MHLLRNRLLKLPLRRVLLVVALQAALPPAVALAPRLRAAPLLVPLAALGLLAHLVPVLLPAAVAAVAAVQTRRLTRFITLVTLPDPMRAALVSKFRRALQYVAPWGPSYPDGL